MTYKPTQLQKMIRILFLSVFLLFVLNISAQKFVRTTGEAQIELTKDKSRLDTEKKARELATINALEKAFGRVVIQGNTTYLTNLNTGEKAVTKSVFNMIANTSVKGEVVEVLEESFMDIPGYKYINGVKTKVTEIKCEITIKAVELKTPTIEFNSFPLGCLNIDCKKTSFKDNDDFYFYFSSPISGYISIFLDDREYSYRLIPYSDMPAKYESGMPVKADKEYFLFTDNPGFDYFEEEENFVDTYQLYSEALEDMNRIFVIFSKEPLNKPRLQKDIDKEVLSDKEIKEGYEIPKSLRSEDFQRWLNKNRSYAGEDMQVDIIDISISKR